MRRPALTQTAEEEGARRFSPSRIAARFSNRLSLANRILAVNIFAILLLMGGLLFLDNYRERLFDQQREDVRLTAELIASLSDRLDGKGLMQLIEQEASINESRVRLFGPDGALVYDSFARGAATYELRDASDEDFVKQLARLLDRLVDFMLLKDQPPQYVEPPQSGRDAWSLFRNVEPNKPRAQLYYAGDFTPVLVGAAESGDGEYSVLVTRNPRSVRRIVRAERFNIFLFSSIVVAIAVALSLFLARTLVDPLQTLTRAAVKVRWGRERQVTVPRLPERRDEIGLLARALSDMTDSLRERIDATEAFAADVAHEIKNPIASLRSALEGLRTIEDPELQKRLFDIAEDDVRRMDRLITDISEVSRVEPELSRTRFEPVDLGAMIEQIVAGREGRAGGEQAAKKVTIAFARPRAGSAVVMGEDMRLARVFDNLLDNAISFSPPGGLVEIVASEVGENVIVRVSDEGPGVPEQEREAIFTRFHSNRPKDEADDARHSGLGLAICRTIVEAHQGDIEVHDRDDGRPGALFEIILPSARHEETA